LLTDNVDQHKKQWFKFHASPGRQQLTDVSVHSRLTWEHW